MYYLLFYRATEDYIEKRAPYRESHLAYAKAAHQRGTLIMGGALADPADGAVLIFQGDEPSVAEEFARNDPYVKSSVITEWQVRPWTVVIGGS